MLVKKLVALLVVLAVFALGGCNNPFAGPSEVDLEAKAVQLARDTAKGGYELLAVAELKKWLDEGTDMLIVDTMPFEDSYKKNHIPGAVQFLFPIPDMPEWKMTETGDKSEQDFANLLGPDKERPLVFYCGFVKCTRSHNAAMWARNMGYTKVYRLPGGIVAWKEAKYPVKSVN